MFELLFLHHAVDGLVGHFSAQKIDDETIPPVGVIAEENDGTVAGKLAQVIKPPACNGMKGTAGEIPKIDEKERIQNVVFIGGNHKLTIGAISKLAKGVLRAEFGSPGFN